MKKKTGLPITQIICFGLITIICIIAIFEVVYFAMNPEALKKKKVADNTIKNSQIIDNNLAEDFDSVFQNKLEKSNTSEDVEKIAENKDYVYTSYEKKESSSPDYDVNVEIPTININSEEIKTYNEEINQIFQAKADSILNGSANKSVYSVSYEAFLNDNILSVVIKSTLKEGNDPQRVIIQTYCYNVKEMKKVEFSDILKLKNLDSNTVQERIKKQVQGKQEEAKSLQQLGYSVYIRDLRSDKYDVENISNFFIDNKNNVYIIYAYGNTTKTDVVDIITI